MKKILIVDDEKDILEFLSYNLKKEGFSIYTASDGLEGLEKTKKIKPDLIIVDLMMPKMNGIEMCENIRNDKKLSNVIILFLTARSEDYTQIAALDSGADDFIKKPIKPKLLISKVKSIMRRFSLNKNLKNYIHKDVELDIEKYSVKIKGDNINLARKEFDLLKLLINQPGKVYTREEILNDVWGNDIHVVDRTIDVHINRLRDKLGQKFIETIKGIGYKICE
jgi:two-component system alkaline phosphatase synthesis response regulator PhoP|tara:strand:+ start:1715 stop:2383 length:669 start_codon:yes stop_codon:yes gene_type:complete